MSTVSTVYVVMGMYSEYSDRVEWQVAAYLDEDKAKKHVELATDAMRIWEAKSDDERDEIAGFTVRRNTHGEEYRSPNSTWMNPLDTVRGFETYTYNQRYWLSSVELLEEVPT